MKKLFLFIGVIMLSLHFSCKKDFNPIPVTVNDSLPITLTIGTWWKYQRIDSVWTLYYSTGYQHNIDTSIELVTIVGKTPLIIYNETRLRSDTVESCILEIKNITKGKVDTSQAFYNDNHFFMFFKSYPINLFIKVPLIEGFQLDSCPFQYGETDSLYVKKNVSVSVFNQNFNNSINTEENWSQVFGSRIYFTSYNNHTSSYLKSGVGFVYMSNHQVFRPSPSDYMSEGWYIRKLIDYHISP